MSITSWPGPGVGGATSSSLRSSTGPHARQITALIHPEEYTGEAPCGGRDTDADCGGSSSRQRRSTTIEPVRVYMRVPGTQPMPRLVRLVQRSEEHTSELQSRLHLVCRLLLEKKKKNTKYKCTI